MEENREEHTCIPVEVETVESEVTDNEDREEGRRKLVLDFIQSTQEAVAL